MGSTDVRKCSFRNVWPDGAALLSVRVFYYQPTSTIPCCTHLVVTTCAMNQTMATMKRFNYHTVKHNGTNIKLIIL